VHLLFFDNDNRMRCRFLNTENIIIYKSDFPMNILNRYVARSFLATFFMSIFVLTFGMTGGNLMKVFDYISRGIP